MENKLCSVLIDIYGLPKIIWLVLRNDWTKRVSVKLYHNNIFF